MTYGTHPTTLAIRAVMATFPDRPALWCDLWQTGVDEWRVSLGTLGRMRTLRRKFPTLEAARDGAIAWVRAH